MDNSVSRWDFDTIRWYKNAAGFDDCYTIIADKILSSLGALPHICDIGCGIGCLSSALSASCKSVTAVDISRNSLDYLSKYKPANMSIIYGDFQTLDAPVNKFDAVVSCLFATPAEQFETASKWSDRLFFVLNATPARSFSASGARKMAKAVRYDEDEAFLRYRNIKYKLDFFTAPFGQPFESRDEARRFMRRYDPESTEAEIGTYLDEKLVPVSKPPYTLYLPSERHLVMFDINVK